MKYTFFYQSSLFLLLLSLYISPYPYLTEIQRQSIHETPIKQINKPLVIVIDPGHGGKDLGCSTHCHKEKSFTLPFSLKLGDKIQYHSNKQVQVLFTRSDDSSVSLYTRTAVANAAQADLFISVHANSIDDPSVHGFETYVYGSSSSDHLTVDEDYIYNGAGASNNIADHILTNMAKSNHLKESILLAENINKKIEGSKRLKNRGVKQAQFKVLKNADMPSVLLEMGYLTNTKDAALLLSEKGQNTLADKIAKAILEYLQVL